MRGPAALAIGLLYGITPLAASETDRMLAKVDPRLVAQCEAALRTELEPRIAARIGPIVLTEERSRDHASPGARRGEYGQASLSFFARVTRTR